MPAAKQCFTLQFCLLVFSMKESVDGEHLITIVPRNVEKGRPPIPQMGFAVAALAVSITA